ncbi:MAG: gamma-glutamyl-gamma-aminobutyrate hydrolase family protein [Candidatus Rokubacteria bacterium]|nr:gamma-glutamyl-gamma-aminobutyrate hydrolase family protein [Candidatus Rokubacteria bacterium]
MSAPFIGITTSITTDKTPERAYLNTAYFLAAQRAGGIPVLLPPRLDGASLDALWIHLGGIILTGGGDIDPARFGQTPHPATADVSAARDGLELGLAERALAERVSLLAICRGSQVLNVACGGSLLQDIPSVIPGPIAHSQTEPRSQATHDVKVEAGSALGDVLGRLDIAVNSMHHQAIDRLGRGLRAVAWAPDGIIEGIEFVERRGFALGVQWHPEDLAAHDPAAANLFAALVRAATNTA